MSSIKHRIKQILLGFPLTVKAVQLLRQRRRKSFDAIEGQVTGLHGIEIGGPTPIFRRGGPFPVYTALGHLDNINFSERNFWSSVGAGFNFEYDPQKSPGQQFIRDAIDLHGIDDSSYDVVLSSHAIEHIANPLKALHEWRRLLRPGGLLVIVAPDKRYTYDRNRPVTPLQHIRDDFSSDMQEDDDTHFDEIIRLHDLENDGTVATFEEHRARTLDNAKHRIAHQHVFDIELLEALVVEAGFEVMGRDVFRPYHLLVVAQLGRLPV